MFETSVSPPAPLNLDIEYQNADLWSLWGGANAPRAPPLVTGLKFHVACFVFSHFNSLLPTPVSSILHFNSEYHDYMTHSRFNLHKTCHKYQFAITWQAPIIWNDIPLTVGNNLTVSNFKKN